MPAICAAVGVLPDPNVRVSELLLGMVTFNVMVYFLYKTTQLLPVGIVTVTPLLIEIGPVLIALYEVLMV